MSFKLYCPEYWRWQSRKNTAGISDRSETLSGGSCTICCSVCRIQQTDDGTVPECKEWGSDYSRNGVPSDSCTLVSYDRSKTDDRWNHQRSRCNDVFCSCNCTRSDYQNFICNDVQQKFWKHWNLDGMAIWLDCSYSADVDFL